MKLNTKHLLGVLAATLFIFFVTQSFTNAEVEYGVVHVESYSKTVAEIHLTLGGSYEIITSKKQNYEDQTPLTLKLHELRQKGWEVINHATPSSDRVSVMLKRVK